MADSDPVAQRPRRTAKRARVLIGAALCAAALGGGLVACGDDDDSGDASATAAFPTGTPTEVTDVASGFPAPNGDYSNTRAVGGKIDASNVATLEEAWSVPLAGESPFGVYSSTPIVTDDTVYLQDINSNVQAVDRATGEVKWTKKYDSLSVGPNGVALGGGLVVGGTADGAFALDADTGEVVWEKLKLIQDDSEGVDMAPLVWNDTVYISTVPGTELADFYRGNGRGIVFALDLKTGEEKWKFDTTTDNLWGNPKLNSGGGLWGTPSVDDEGNVYMSVANPGPWPGTPEFPDGASRKGDNLYTNSLVVLDGKTGEVKWHYQAIGHDLRDWDLHLGPILTDFTIDGEETPVAVLSGKMGTVYVVNRDTHELIWKKDVGKHTPEAGFQDGIGTTLQGTKVTKAKADEDGPDRNAPFETFTDPVVVYPGWLGGVETPMAVSDGVIYVPVNNLCGVYFRQENYTAGAELCDFATSSGEMLALDGATGDEVWKAEMPTQNYGGATVVNDVVIGVDFNGLMHAYNKADGKEVWTQQLPAASNSAPAVADDAIIAGAGFAATPDQKPAVVAYRLPE